MENEFIPYIEALALKELGFDEDCVAAYKTNYRVGDLTWGGVNGFVPFYKEQIIKQNEIKWVKVIQAPLYQQAFRWFRENYGYFQLFDFQVGDSKITKGFFFNIINIHNEDFFFPEDFENIIYKTYEEAELECLKKLIEIVKKEQC